MVWHGPLPICPAGFQAVVLCCRWELITCEACENVKKSQLGKDSCLWIFFFFYSLVNNVPDLNLCPVMPLILFVWFSVVVVLFSLLPTLHVRKEWWGEGVQQGWFVMTCFGKWEGAGPCWVETEGLRSAAVPIVLPDCVVWPRSSWF